jgi:hypothetical protein
MLQQMLDLLNSDDDDLALFVNLFARWVARNPELITHLDPAKPLHLILIRHMLAYPRLTANLRRQLARNPKICAVML